MNRVLIVGGGRVGAFLVRYLLDAGHRVMVVEADADRAALLARDFPDAAVVHGSGSDAEVLERAGVRAAKTLVAATGLDQTNLVTCSMARFEFGIGRTIARVVNPKNAWLYTGDFGVDVALDQGEVIARLVMEEMSLGEMVILAKLRRGRVALVESRIQRGTPHCGSQVVDLDLPGSAVLIAVLRADEYVPVRGDTVLREDDELLAVVHADEAIALSRYLASPA